MRASDLEIVILAAGEGKRMRSALPKVLHPIGGRPMLERVIAVAAQLDPRRIHVVYGHGGDLVRDRLRDQSVAWVLQDRQLGTGDAVARALPGIPGGRVLVLYGDVPLITPETLGRLVASAEGGLGLLTARLDDPCGYGRIVRNGEGGVRAIIEERDATEAERDIREVNTGLLAADAEHLRRWLADLGNDNAQAEYYLTDVVAMAVAEGCPVSTCAPASVEEVTGVNDRGQLAALERRYQRRIADALMEGGVTLLDPDRIDVRGSVAAGRDVVIDVNVVFEGSVTLGDGVRIGPNNVIRDSVIGAGTEILPNCVVEGARLEAGCRIGPFSRVRPETELREEVRIGNFVEVKKSVIGPRSKVNHLTYVGDAEVGRDVNVGAGTITCNYDGANKHRTVIEDEAFIGSGVELVAPVRVGAGATIGAGSTIGRDAPAGELTLERSRQKTVPGWRRPIKRSAES